MQIISRDAWGARAPKTAPAKVAPARRVFYVVHYSGAPATQTVQAIQDWCMNAPPHGRGFNDIDYNFLVRGTTGEIYEGRGWDVVGSHTVDYNTTGIGVCVISDGPISDAAKRAVRWLYDQANTRCGKTLTIKGHRELATTGTDCPGTTIFVWVRAGLPIQEDDMSADDVRDGISDFFWGATHAARQDDTYKAADSDVQKSWRNARDTIRAVTGGPVDQAALLAAIVAGGSVDEQALAAALVPALATAILDHLPEAGLTEDQVEDAVRNVLRAGVGG